MVTAVVPELLPVHAHQVKGQTSSTRWTELLVFSILRGRRFTCVVFFYFFVVRMVFCGLLGFGFQRVCFQRGSAGGSKIVVFAIRKHFNRGCCDSQHPTVAVSGQPTIKVALVPAMSMLAEVRTLRP